MDNPPAGVTALAAEIRIEDHPQLFKLADPRKGLGGQQTHRALPAESATRRNRVRGVQLRTVVGRECCSDTTLGEIAVRRKHAPFRQQQHFGARLGSGQRRRQAGDTATDNQQICLPHEGFVLSVANLGANESTDG